MMKHYDGVLTSLPFLQAPRSGFVTHRCCRFRKSLTPKVPGPWNHCGTPDAIDFTVDKPIITLHHMEFNILVLKAWSTELPHKSEKYHGWLFSGKTT